MTKDTDPSKFLNAIDEKIPTSFLHRFVHSVARMFKPKESNERLPDMRDARHHGLRQRLRTLVQNRTDREASGLYRLVYAHVLDRNGKVMPHTPSSVLEDLRDQWHRAISRAMKNWMKHYGIWNLRWYPHEGQKQRDKAEIRLARARVKQAAWERYLVQEKALTPEQAQYEQVPRGWRLTPSRIVRYVRQESV